MRRAPAATGRTRAGRRAAGGTLATTPSTARPTCGCRRCPRGRARPPAPRRRPPRTAPLGRDELAALGLDTVEQLAEGVRELVHALPLEHGDDVAVIDAGLGDPVEDAPGLVDVALERELDAPVILERLDRLLRHRVHGLGADQLLDVEHVAVLGVLGGRRGPQTALRRRALRAQA